MKSGIKQWKMRSVMVRALSFSALAALTLHPAPTPAATSGTRPSAASGASTGPSTKRSAPRGSRQEQTSHAAAATA